MAFPFFFNNKRKIKYGIMPYDISKKILFLILLPDVIMRIITWSIHNIFNRRFRFTVSVICYMVKYFLPGVFPIKIWWDKKTIDINIKHIALACFWRVTNNIPFNITPSFFDFFLHSFHSLSVWLIATLSGWKNITVL